MIEKNHFISKGLNYLLNGNLKIFALEFKHIFKQVRIYIFIYFIYLKIRIKIFLKKDITLVYDNRISPPTYGDYLVFLMLVRFLSLLSKKITFVLIQDELREDWYVLSNSEIADFQRQQILLTEYILRDFDIQNFIVLENNHLQMHSKNTILSKLFNYQHAYGVIQLLAKHKIKKNEFPKDFLLSAQSINTRLPFKYVAWNVRKGKWAPERDAKPELMVRDYISLRNLFPSNKIMLFSVADGLDFAFETLKHNLPKHWLEDLKENLIKQPVSDYISCLPYLLSSEFYFQRIGGGLAEILNYSEIPHLVVETQGYYYFYSKFRLLPWHKKNQLRTGSVSYFSSMSIELILKFIEKHQHFK